MLPVIHIIWNFIVKLISNSYNSSKWYGREAIFKCIKDNFVLISTIFVLLNWSTLWYLQLVSSVSVKALIYSNILGLCSLFLVRILQPELNGSISPLFKFEKGISFFRQDLQHQRLGPFVIVCKFVCKYYYEKCVSSSHICHSKLHCNLWQQSSHILGKET